LLDVMFFALFSVAVLVTIFTVVDREEIAWPILAFISWIAVAGASATTESVHVLITSTDNVVEHVTSHANGVFPIIFFFGLAVVYIALFFNRFFEMRKMAVKGG